MSNPAVVEDVRWALDRAVGGAFLHMPEDEDDAMHWAVEHAAGDAVYWVVSRTVQQDPAYPAFQDFLEEVRP